MGGVGQPVAVRGFHAGPHLEDEGAEVVVDVSRGAVHAHDGAVGQGQGQVEEQVEQLCDAKFCIALANITGVVIPERKRSWSSSDLVVLEQGPGRGAAG